MSSVPFRQGEPAPWFVVRSPVNPQFHFHTVAGRYTVLCFYGSAGDPASRRILDDILRARDRFDDQQASFFGVSTDPADEQRGEVREHLPGIHQFWDFDGKVSRLYQAIDAGGSAGTVSRRFSLVLDERLRVFGIVPFDPEPETHVARVLELLDTLPPLEPTRPAPTPAPVLVVPRIFEPELCRILIRYYEEHGGVESGFMRDVGGRTVPVYENSFKRRRDQEITDEELRKACMVRIHDRLLPELSKAFQFRATRIERYIVACYDDATNGHFRPHRDHMSRGTAHRRFAVSLNLNTGEYEGGALRFPEFGRQSYTPPAGGAVVFSCALLHEAMPVTSGRRFAFLPFLYDEAAAKIRQENMQFVGNAASASPQDGTGQAGA